MNEMTPSSGSTGSQPTEERAAVPASMAGQRADQVAAQLFPHYSRAALSRWLADEALLVDGRSAKASQRLRGGEELQLTVVAVGEQWHLAQDLPLDVLFEDEHVLVLNKPAGLTVHPGAGRPDGTLVNALLHHRPHLSDLPRAGIVHRLDRQTSGVMVVASSLVAHTALVRQIAARQVHRAYVAFAHGHLAADCVVEAPIGRHPRNRLKQAVVPQGKAAVTRVFVLSHLHGVSAVKAELESGRMHQIRVHMAHLGHPLVGDAMYGGQPLQSPPEWVQPVQALLAANRQALHAQTLAFQHPVSDEPVAFEAPRPSDLQFLWPVT